MTRRTRETSEQALDSTARHVPRRMFAGAAAFLILMAVQVVTAHTLRAQETPTNSARERRASAGFYVTPGWHPHLAIAPAIPLGRLGDLVSMGMAGQVGASFITGDPRWPGIGVDFTYATLPKSTDEPLPGRYQLAGASLHLTSKGGQRVFFDWLGAYGTVGVGAFRHGAAGSTTHTSPSASIGVGILVPLFGHDGFIESRFHHVFSGKILGRGNGLTFAPLLLGLRF